METKTWLLTAMIALSAGMGLSISMPTGAGNACIKMCQRDYSECWYGCTPGNTGCYDGCREQYLSCEADC